LFVNAPGLQSTRQTNQQGQSLVEFALLFPLLILLTVNAVNFGGLFFAWITVANAARGATQYWARGVAAPGSPDRPTAAEVTTLVTNDISSLLNRSSLVVRACTNNNGILACSGTGSYVPPVDPEPLTFISASVEVTYIYQPFIPLFDFSQLNIHATLPPTTVHSRDVTRVMQ
jgi:hypothetical protein